MCYLTFTRVLEIEYLSETLVLHQKYVGDVGCVVWDAAIVLAKYLEEISKNQSLCLKGKKVLELGAGVGCVGLTAACFGAEVLLTDLPEIVPLLELNVQQNQGTVHKHKGSVKVSSLNWEEPHNSSNFQPDVILLADCVYYEKSSSVLVDTLDNFSSENTLVLMCQEMRESELQKHNWDSFMKKASQKFTFKYIPLSQQHPEFRCPDIKLIELRKKQKLH